MFLLDNHALLQRKFTMSEGSGCPKVSAPALRKKNKSLPRRVAFRDRRNGPVLPVAWFAVRRPPPQRAGNKEHPAYLRR